MPFSNALDRFLQIKLSPWKQKVHFTGICNTVLRSPPPLWRDQLQLIENLVSFQQILLVLVKPVLLREESFVALSMAIFLENISFPNDWEPISVQKRQCCLSVLGRMKLTLKEQSATQSLNSAGGGRELLRQMLPQTRRRAHHLTAGTQPVTSVCFSFLPNL